MKTVRSAFILLVLSVQLSSCYTYQEVVSSEISAPEAKLALIKENLAENDYVSMVVYGKEYRYLRVKEIRGPYLVLKTYSDQSGFQETFVRCDQIDSLTLYEEYRDVGWGVVASLIFFYLAI